MWIFRAFVKIRLHILRQPKYYNIQLRSSVTKSGGAQIFPQKWKAKKEKKKKKKNRRVGVVQGNLSIDGNILRVYNYSVRSIAGLRGYHTFRVFW